MKNTIHIGKYIFPTYDKALEMKESLQSTEENPCFHIADGLIREKTTEATGDKEAIYSDRYQLDVIWDNLPLGKDGYTIDPWYEFNAKNDIKGQGNHRMGEYDYNKLKI